MYVANVTFSFAAVIINYLMSLVLRLLLTGSITSPKWTTRLIESLSVLFAFVLPLMYLWTPLTAGNYGLAQTYCTVKLEKEASACTQNHRDLTILLSVKTAVAVEMLIAEIITLAAYVWMRSKLSAKQMNLLIHRSSFLLILGGLSVSTIVMTILYHSNIDQKAFAVVNVVWFPIFYETNLVILFIALTRMSNTSFKKSGSEDQGTHQNQTNPTSQPLNQRSYTYFSIPFTTLTMSINGERADIP